MQNIFNRARGATAAVAIVVGGLALTACDPKNELLSPQQPGVISPSSVNSATAADAVYIGALSRWKLSMNGGGGNTEAIWNWEALFTDELRSGDTFSQRNDADQRNTQSNDAVLLPIYNAAQQARGRARDGINAELQYNATAAGKTHVGELYLAMGYIEDILSEAFCNGLSFGETVNGVPQYTPQMDNQAAAKVAIARFDTALTYLGTDAASLAVKNAVLIARARAQVDIGDFTGAAATVASVPTSYQYNWTYSQTTSDNEWWVMGPSVQRYSAGDSLATNGTPILNAIPFAELNDPRVSVTNTKHAGEDNVTTFIQVNNWGRDDPIPPLSGIDARLIEAEAKLQAGDYAGMTNILNALRGSPQVIGAFNVAAMSPLAVPGDKTSAVNLFFREKALWQFERGWRMGDLRRMVRQYGRDQATVYPSGTFVRNGTPSGTYGTEVAFPIPDQGVGSEISNPNFKGCLDTKA